MANFYPPGFENEKKNLAIDFDGVIHNADKGWGDGTCYGEPLPGALEALKLLSQKYKIIIFTAKAKPDRPLVNGKTGAVLVLEWLKKHNVHQYVSSVTSEKPRADLYIDDNGYRFANWGDTLKFIENEL
jgi:FMN phosphatase YigB (HAD superfamily)